MATLKTVHADSRSGPAASPEASARNTDLRPYLVTPGRKFLPLFPHESEDARITGETRSLFRRLLALNLPHRNAAEVKPDLNLDPRVDSRPAGRIVQATGAKIA